MRKTDLDSSGTSELDWIEPSLYPCHCSFLAKLNQRKIRDTSGEISEMGEGIKQKVTSKLLLFRDIVILGVPLLLSTCWFVLVHSPHLFNWILCRLLPSSQSQSEVLVIMNGVKTFMNIPLIHWTINLSLVDSTTFVEEWTSMQRFSQIF